MDNTNKKIVKLISELTGFCYHYGAKDVTIHSNTTSSSINIDLTANNVEKLDQDTLEQIQNRLSSPRCKEIEEYYWGVSGEDSTDPELILVGMMTDTATINYDIETHTLRMTLTRKL